MELKDLEECCCVIEVSDALLISNRVSFSGVIVQPQNGTIICAGLPFSRFITERDNVSSGTNVLFPHNFGDNFKIRVSFSTQAGQKKHKESLTYPQTKQHNVSADLLMLVNCEDFEQAFRSVFKEADQWRFQCDAEDAELIRDAKFLSWFAVLRADGWVDSSSDSGSIPWQSSSSLQKGCPVIACGSPFGSLCLDLFISTLSRGIISNLTGKDNTVILTDARCLPGTEGGGLFVVEGAESVRLIGLIVSPFGWKANEWIGLSLVCSFHSILRNIIRFRVQDPICDSWHFQREANIHMSTTAHDSKAAEYPTVCYVGSGGVWGSGVVVTSKLVVTCRHVVNGKSTVNLKFHQGNRIFNVVGIVLFSTEVSSSYDFALVKMRTSVPEILLPRMSQSFNPGEAVVVMGYGGLGQACGPSLTCGVLSKTISLNDVPVLLQTTCAVQAGTSGGAVVRKHSGELLGIVSSNTRDLAAKVTYPHLNYSIPVTVFQSLLQKFHQTRDANVFESLNTTESRVRRIWRLQGPQSKL